jgi:LmbE family N-acetylglucosaminyl deacetylase
MKPRLAAVFAHPDDDAWLIGGTLALHAGEVEVTIVLLTSGGNGPIWEPVATRETLAATREREEAAWLEAIGAPDARVEFLRYEDWRLPEASFEEVVERVAGILLEARPHVVVTFGPDGVTHHQDHVRAGEIGMEAFHRARRDGSDGQFLRLYHACLRRSSMDAYYAAAAARGLPLGDQDTPLNQVGVADELITVDIDVMPVYERKVEAIRAHRSQIGELERIPRDLQPLHLAHECFVLAWPEQDRLDRVGADLFEGVAAPDAATS